MATVTDFQFGVGDGSKTAFTVIDPSGNAAVNPVISSLFRTDWRGKITLSTSARTNLRSRSQEINISDSTGWSPGTYPVTVTADQAVAPDGTTTADLVVPTTATNNHGIPVVTPTAVTSGQVYTMSFYIKPFGAQRYIAAHGDVSAGRLGGFVGYDLVLGTVTGGTGATITSVGNGWFRIVQVMTAASTGNSTLAVILRNTSGANFESYTGNTSNGFYLWGVQLETGGAATAYIPTTNTTASVTDYSLAGSVATLSPAPLAAALLSWTGTDSNPAFNPRGSSGVGMGLGTAFGHLGVN